MSQIKIFQTTDELWTAVINSLPEEIKEKVSAPAGKAYFHVKPKTKHLGIKDFKYTVEYSSRSAKATVNVETLNGGEQAKESIQNYIDSHNADSFIKEIVANQGVKNKNKWLWTTATEASELNEGLAQWYVDTLTAFWNFFETDDCSEVPAVEEVSATKRVRVALFAREEPKFISLQTLCEDDMEVVDDNGASEETYDYLLDSGCGEWVNLVFVQSGCPVELYVTDPEADDEDDEYNLYTDEEFEIIPDYGVMNMEEAEENYCDEEDREQLEEYTAYLDVKMGDDHGRLTNKGIKSAWERLKSNEVNCENFVPAVMQYVMNEEGNPQAFLRGTQVEDITMVFYIDIPENEDFNPSKLDFINIDACYDDNSEVLSELLADDLVLLNAVIYDGKMYFADGYDDITEDYDGDCYYDIVDENIESI